jgi:diacylglycerol kinase (ATP)
MKFSVQKRLASFRYAFAGIRIFLGTQHNVWIQIAIAVLTVVAGFILHIERLEWVMILSCIGLVLALEAVNTSIEYLADTVHPEMHDGIRKVKDIAAGAVLIASITAAIIGLIIFIPYLEMLLDQVFLAE